MRFKQGSIGRVFLLRFDEGEDALAGLKKFAASKKIRAAWLQVLGATRSTELVSPNKPNHTTLQLPYSDLMEVVAIGNIFWKKTGRKEEPVIHLHAALGKRGNSTRTGCVREKLETYAFLEVLVLELKGLGIGRIQDSSTGFFKINV